MKLDINGKTALVTGSSKGIGKSIAQNLSVEGCNIMLNGRNSHSLQRAMKTMKSKTDYFVADVTKPDECKLLVEHTIEQFGKLDILVCNVGSGRTVQQGKETLHDWIEMFRVNLFSAINTIKAAERYLKKSCGTIVCISSIVGIENTGAPVTYSAAKSALNTFVHNESKKLGKSKIRINAVAPGNIMFPGSVWEAKKLKNSTKIRKMLSQDVALGRFGKPEEVANLVTFLASSKSAYITGSVFVIDGGQIQSY